MTEGVLTLVTLEDRPDHPLVNLGQFGGCVDGDSSGGLVLEHDVWLLSVQSDPDRFELDLEQPTLLGPLRSVQKDDHLDGIRRKRESVSNGRHGSSRESLDSRDLPSLRPR